MVVKLLVEQNLNEDLEHKLKRERVEICLNCKSFSKCNEIGKFEDCADFEEAHGEAWVIRQLVE